MADILIVDDDPLVREYLSIMVKMAGHVASVAAHGGHAIEMMADEHYDLALVDIFMPEKEGIETICEIRKRFPVTRIVAMSGGCRTMPSSQALDFAICLGADDVLPKPFSMDHFDAVVRQTLGRSTRLGARSQRAYD